MPCVIEVVQSDSMRDIYVLDITRSYMKSMIYDPVK
jgi:hypothetical protein